LRSGDCELPPIELRRNISDTANNPWQNSGLNDAGLAAIDGLLVIASDPDLKESLIDQLVPLLARFPNLKRGLAPLLQFIENTRNPKSFLVFLDRDRDAMPTLLQILSIDSIAVEWLISDPDSFDWLRLSAGQQVDSEHLKDILISEIQNLEDEEQILASMRRFRRRETLRVICSFCLQDMPQSTVAQQLSWIADAGIAAALVAANAERKTERRSRSQNAGPVLNLSDSLCAIGLRALGGQELELGSTLEMVLLTDSEQFPDDSRSAYFADELQRLTQRAITILTHPQGLGYSVAFPYNPELSNQSEVHVHDYRRWIQTIENHGRTWQRLTLLKSRFLAGNIRLASRFLDEFPTLVYRRYLTRADIAGIGALKRKIDREGKAIETVDLSGHDWSIELLMRWKREIEFLTQFLQLINGGELVEIRVANTLQAIDALAQSSCLSEQERSILVTAYNRFSQTVFAMQLRDPLALEQSETSRTHESEQLYSELADSWSKVKQIRNHLRGEVFADENQASDETDLILDPNPKPEWIDALLGKYRFKRSNAAYRFLMELSQEEVSMLSTRRCRHFLSGIATQLLTKIGETPDPDLTLENLAVSCRSLGGKGILWELFSVHEPSLDLYVRLCGASPYLIGILTSNPGMIDELLDSLMLNRLPSEQQLGLMLHDLCRGAEDIEPIIHSFKNARHLNVGVRDILGKESITDTHRALSDIADVCLHQTVDWQYARLVKRFGVPTNSDGRVCRFGVVALGKLGAREPNYHSDISLLFLYDSDGTTRPIGSGRHHEPISSEYFFLQLAQKVAQAANRVWRSGRLYETKNWLVSSGRNTTLAWKLDEFRRYFLESDDLALQTQQLCNARCILGEPPFQREVYQTIAEIVQGRPWTEVDERSVLLNRKHLELTASEFNIKRGIGGTMDVETVAQLLMLRHVVANPEIFVAGTLEAIERLRSAGLLESTDADALREGYNFLRGVESGLRLMNTQARHDLPTSNTELSRLAYVLNLKDGRDLVRQCEQFRISHRSLFEKYLTHP
jgi:[glutamine synthetase] adenylyltransferase / [glutamine synthetase]-adenylyl-L-tyrosine phosphorylase